MCHILKLKCIKFAPDPAEGAYSAPQRSPDSPAGFYGPTSKEKEGRKREGKREGKKRGKGREGKG